MIDFDELEIGMDVYIAVLDTSGKCDESGVPYLFINKVKVVDFSKKGKVWLQFRKGSMDEFDKTEVFHTKEEAIEQGEQWYLNKLVIKDEADKEGED